MMKPDDLTPQEQAHKERISKIVDRLEDALQGETIGDGIAALLFCISRGFSHMEDGHNKRVVASMLTDFIGTAVKGQGEHLQ